METDSKVDNNELQAPYEIRKKIMEEFPDADYDDHHTWSVDEACVLQAEDLRMLANAIEITGIPLATARLTIGTRYAGNDKAAIRRQAKLAVEFIRACHRQLDIKKIDSDWSWGIESTLDSQFQIAYSVFNEATCEYVPVLDEAGNTQTVTTTKMISVDVEEVFTEKKCMPIFGPDEHPDA
jgi:hypothetical protein